MARRRALTSTALALAALCACVLSGCGATQYRTLNAAALEPLVSVNEYPIFWLGGRFRGLPLTLVSSDPSGAYEVQYGTCTSGGPETCISPVEVISQPDNSFLPGAGVGPTSGTATIRGVRALFAQGGKVVEIPTGPVVVDIRATSSSLALAAARQMVPINELGTPEAKLAAAQPNSGFADRPTEGQRPQQVQGLPAGRPAKH